MNRYEMHTFEINGGTRIIIIKKWSGETFFCCAPPFKWKNLGRPYVPHVPRLEDLLEELPDMIEPTPTN